MQMISASKMRRAQNAVIASRSYSEKAREVLSYVATEPGRSKTLHPLLEERPQVNAIGIVLFTADRGLAGAYNMNVIRKTVDFVKQQKAPAKFITVGRRGRDLVRRMGYQVVADFSGMGDRPQIGQISALARGIMDEFLEHRVDQVYLASTNFVNVLRQVPTITPLLPIPEAQRKHEGPEAVYLYEPSAEQILAQVLPRFVQVLIYQALLEAVASEHAARMVAMRNATDNANELIESLTLLRNKVRQTAITKEMLDIAGGAEALRQSLANR